jgi:hypothetical protein
MATQTELQRKKLDLLNAIKNNQKIITYDEIDRMIDDLIKMYDDRTYKWEYEHERRIAAELIINRSSRGNVFNETYNWQSIVSRESNVYKTDKTE